MTEVIACLRRPGRPRVVPNNEVPTVLALYRQGLGYRAISRELGYRGVLANWSTIRRIIKGNSTAGPKNASNIDTILTRGAERQNAPKLKARGKGRLPE